MTALLIIGIVSGWAMFLLLGWALCAMAQEGEQDEPDWSDVCKAEDARRPHTSICKDGRGHTLWSR